MHESEGSSSDHEHRDRSKHLRAEVDQPGQSPRILGHEHARSDARQERDDESHEHQQERAQDVVEESRHVSVARRRPNRREQIQIQTADSGGNDVSDEDSVGDQGEGNREDEPRIQ